MSKELPHASLQCSDCGTTFRVTLKKGRVPSRPIPCPTCKTPITVDEDDIVHPGERRTRAKTKPGDVLRKTKLASVDRGSIASLMDDPPTAEVPTDDPPTAELDVDAREIAAAMDESAPAFGIIQKKKIGPKVSDTGAHKETPLGVDVANPVGRGRRDNVFGDPTNSSVAIGRISTRQVKSLDKQLDPDDPNLPVAPTGKEAELPADAPKKKLDLSRLRRVMAKLEVDEDEAPEDESFKNPLDDFDLNIDEDVDDLIGDASNAIEAELNLLADSEAENATAAPDEVSEPEIEEPQDEPEAEPEVEASEPQVEPEVPESEPQPDDEIDEPVEVEPVAGTLDVADSEAYELGTAPVPARIPDAPKRRGIIPGVLAGLLVLVIFAALFYLMAR